MTILVSVETLLLVLLILLVAGLLRSHAELLRRLGPGADGIPAPDADRVAAPRRDPGAPAPTVSGTTPSGDAVSVSFEGGASAPTLLAFLTTGCSTCAGFWDELGEQSLPAGVQTVIVTKGSEREQPARLRTLSPARVPVVMSSAAWDDYAVPGAPYFVLVDGTCPRRGRRDHVARALLARRRRGRGPAPERGSDVRCRGDRGRRSEPLPGRPPRAMTELVVLGCVAAVLGAVASAWSP